MSQTAAEHSFFKSIEIQGFRRLVDVSLPLRPLTVMIGANGSGKTSFLDVWALLASASSGRLAEKISEFGGLGDILTKDRSSSVNLGVAMEVPGREPLDYHVRIEPQGHSHAIARETLTQERPSHAEPFQHIDSHHGDIQYYSTEERRFVRPNWAYEPHETALSQVPKMFREPEVLRRRLSSSTYYSALDVSPKSPIRLPQPLRPASLPGSRGEDLVSCLFDLRERDRDRYEMLTDGISSAFPDFERLDFPPVAAGTLAMTWKDRNFSRPMYMHQLSEGTLRFLWLATLLNSFELTALTMIDEPEISLHPELLSLLVDLMRDASRRTQIVVATHSDRLIRFLKPEEVLVADMDEGATSLTWADTLDLDRWLSDYSLDQLHEMGRLGGRS